MRPARLATHALLLASVALLNGCRPDGGAGGGTVVVGAGADADAIFPPLYQSIQGRVVGELLFDRLAEMGPALNVVGDGGFVPRLASRWEWSPDSLTITFHLDPRARWHDGKPVVAADVVTAYRVIKEPANGSPLVTHLANIDSVHAVDSLTASVHFARRAAEQFYHATQITPVPAHRIASIPAGDSLRRSPEVLNPVGSGRYRLVVWEPKVRTELAAVDDHYRGRAKLDRVLFVISAPAAGMARVWAGETDVWEPLPAPAVADAAPHEHVRIENGPGYEYGFMAFNLHDAKDPKRPHPLFADRALRRAITMAVDRDAVRAGAFDTLAMTALGPFVRAQQTADTTITQIPFDTSAAARELDALGWRRGADGTRRKGAQRLAFAITVPTSSPVRIRAATVLQEQLRRAGIDAQLKTVEFQAMLDDRSAGRFDAMMWVWRTTPSQAGIRGTWGGPSINQAGQNVSGYASAAFDSAVADAQAAIDLAGQRVAYRRAFQTIVDDAPAIWLYEVRNLAAVHTRFRIPAWRSEAWWLTLGDWTVDPAQRLPRDAAPTATP